MGKIEPILGLVFLGLLIFLGFNRHSKDSFNNYHSVLWSDAAGYHAYLPFWLDDDFISLGKEQEKELTRKTGEGFQLQDGYFYTKYPFGVALLQLPFYLIAEISTDVSAAFTPTDHRLILVAGVLYGFMGWLLYYLIMLRIGLSKSKAAFWSVLSLFGTNLFYYIIDSPGYSHVYSYFTLAVLSYSFLVWIETRAWKWLFLTGISIGLLIVIRPFNLVFLMPLIALLPMLGNTSLSSLKISARHLLLLIFPAVLLWGLQVYQWSIMTNELTIDSYADEGFIHLLSPRVAEVLFSPKNGLLLYSPWWIMSFGLLFLLKNKLQILLALLLFTLPVYLYGSWWNWELGCAFGYRGMVEFIGIFSLLSAAALNKSSSGFFKPALALGVICIIWNLKLTYSYDECWMGETWDYTMFFNDLVIGSTR